MTIYLALNSENECTHVQESCSLSGNKKLFKNQFTKQDYEILLK